MKRKHTMITSVVVAVAAIAIGCGGSSKSGKSANGGLSSGPSSGKPAATSAATSKAPHSFGEGTFQVGKDMPAGVYAAAVPNDSAGCYIEVSKNNSGSVDSIIHNDNLSAGSHALVRVAAGQWLKTSGCGDWAPAPATGTQSTTFTEGVFRVGVEIAPGAYTANVPADAVNCYYAISRDGTMAIDKILKNDNLNPGAHAAITIKAGQWLKTDGCGTWTKS